MCVCVCERERERERERAQNWVPLKKKKKKRFVGVLFRTPLFLGKWCGVATYFFIQKKKKSKYMIELFHSLIEKKLHI